MSKSANWARLGILYLTCFAEFGSTGQLHAQTSLATSSAPRIVYDGSQKLGGEQSPLTTDVFWCSGDEHAFDRAVSASALAASYGALANVDSSNPKLPPVVIRTRPIERELFQHRLTSKDQTSASNAVLVRFDTNDATSSLFADRVISKSYLNNSSVLPGSVRSVTSSFSPNYVAVYVCNDFDPSVMAGRLYFQVRVESQKDDALRAAAAVKRALPGLAVATDVEVVGNKAPSKSELRYFYQGDDKLAERTAQAVSSTIPIDLKVKRVPGFEGKVKSGTLEVWIAP